MLKTMLNVVAVGTTDIMQLTENEQRTFFETLLLRITALKQNRETNKG